MDKTNILTFASYLHGHLGPFLVLGLKAGFLANKLVGRNPLQNKVQVFLPLKKPYTCFVDGVQVATGCTLGKLNIKIVNSQNEIRLQVSNEKKSVIIEAKREVLKRILNNLQHKSLEKEALEIWKMNDNELFNWKNNSIKTEYT